MVKDNFNPMRILEALKLAVLGFAAHFGMLFLLSNRGEAGAGGEGSDDGGGEGGTGSGAGGDAGSGSGGNWRDTLPAEIKADPIWGKFKEPADAFRSLVEAQKFLGREKLPVPKDENDKETYAMIFKRLGLPENPDGYVLPTDIEIPKDFPLDENMLADFKKEAHTQGLLPSQVAGLYKWFLTNQIGAYGKMTEAQVSAMKDAETALRKKWGAAYQQNSALAEKVAQSFATERFIQEISGANSLLRNNPGLIEVFANIGKVLSEDQMTGKPHSFTLTPAEAQEKITAIKRDMKHPYWNQSDPNHDAAVEEFQRLIKLTTVGQ